MAQERSFSFTDKALKGLPIPPKPRQLDYFDNGARGLGVRVSYGGRKSFFAMYSNSAGKRQRVSLGEYGRIEQGKLSLAEARKRAKARLGEVAKDQDPAAATRAARTAPTVRTLAADFIVSQRTAKAKSADKQEQILARDVLPVIGNRKARDVKRKDVKAVLKKITDRGAPVMANRAHEIIRAMFYFGIEEEEYGLEGNPAARMKKHRNPEDGRDRWLSLDEIGDYWKALEQEQPGAAAALRLCLLTAQRQQNILGMRLDQLSLADRLWIIPARETKTGKTGKPYRVPLSTATVGIIEARITELEEAEQRRAKRMRRDPEPVTWLFPKLRRGEGPAGLTFTWKAHRAVCERAKIENYATHDHRHSFATHADLMTVPRLIWDGILGHSQSDMANLYSSAEFAERRLECMERWADRIAATLADNVVPIKQDATA